MVRSGRFRLFGTNFGEVRGGGAVIVGGREAIVTRWTMTAIHAYVPEATLLGANHVRVVTATGSSTTRSLEVTQRPSPDGRFKWRFQADSFMIGTPPVVAPNGTVYAMDDHAHLY